MSEQVKKTHWKNIALILGTQGTKWLLLGIVASLLVGFVEYGIAIFLQLLMINLDLIPIENLPERARFLANFGLRATCTFLIVIGILRSIGHFVSQQGAHFFNNIVNTRLRILTLYEMLLDKRHRFIPSTEVNLRFSEIYPKVGVFVSAITSLLVNGIQLVLMMAGMLYLAWKETLFGLVGMAFFGFFLKAFQRAILHSSNQIILEQENIFKGVERISRNWLFIRISNTRAQEYNKMINQFLRQFNFYARAGIFTKTSANLPQLFGTVLLAVLIFVSKSTFHTSGANLLGFLYLFIRFLSNISGFVDSIGNIISVYPHFKRTLEIVDEFPVEYEQAALAPSQSMQMWKIFGADRIFEKLPSLADNGKNSSSAIPAIKISKMCYAWPNQSQGLLVDLNLEVRPCEILGVVGPSGCGKSTLLLVLLGVIKPTSGSVLIGDLTADQFLETRSHEISYVGADPFLIAGSIRENLMYGHNKSQLNDDQEIWQALEKAQLRQSIMEKGGLDYCVNENGDGLSSGQKQRLAIARALLRCPKVMVLDEATANLDVATEEEIALMLKGLSRECTMVIVSHRQGLLKYADRKLMFENGTLKVVQ